MRLKSCLLLSRSPDHPTINSSSEVSLRLRSFVPSDAEFVLNCAPNSKPVHIVARGQFPGSVPAMHCITWQLLKFVSTCQSNCWDDFCFFHSMSIMLAARAAREWERERVYRFGVAGEVLPIRNFRYLHFCLDQSLEGGGVIWLAPHLVVGDCESVRSHDSCQLSSEVQEISLSNRCELHQWTSMKVFYHFLRNW